MNQHPWKDLTDTPPTGAIIDIQNAGGVVTSAVEVVPSFLFANIDARWRWHWDENIGPLRFDPSELDIVDLKPDGIKWVDKESDPDGIPPHEPGAKLDTGKNRLGLVLGAFAPALKQVGEVGTFGANKYTDNGWLAVSNAIERYEDAMLRHWFEYKAGEVLDQDSGLPHLAHMAWNALAILTLTLSKGPAKDENHNAAPDTEG